MGYLVHTEIWGEMTDAMGLDLVDAASGCRSAGFRYPNRNNRTHKAPLQTREDNYLMWLRCWRSYGVE